MDANSRLKRIYLIGIAGTGMGTFAGLLKSAGFLVSGSDQNIYSPMKEKLAQWKIEVSTPYHAKNINKNADLVIVGNVIRKDNPEAKAMRESGLSYTSFPCAFKEFFLQDSIPVVISGTHGKTTCTAIIAHVLHSQNYDPGFLIGGIPNDFEESFRLPSKLNGAHFVIEGDEYDTAYFDKGPKFLHYQPQFLMVTSLEFDHGDIYESVDEIAERFRQLFKLVPSSGKIVIAQHDLLIQTLKSADSEAEILTYGDNGHISATNFFENRHGIHFEVMRSGEKLGKIFVPLSGEHNLENALGCYAMLSALGLSHLQIADGFASFSGVRRRMEEIGKVGSVVVIDDFAHHPTAVKKTILGAQARYKESEIWAIFEPRSATSCTNFFQDHYSQSLSYADKVLLAPCGRKLSKESQLDTVKLANVLNERGVSTRAAHSIDHIVELIENDPPKNAVLLCMSNGAFGGIHNKLLSKLSELNSEQTESTLPS